MKVHDKLEQFTSRELAQVQDNLVVPDGRGGYNVFGRYHLTPERGLCRVKVSGQSSLLFSNKRTALSWCVADKMRQHKMAINIVFLDNKKQILMADIHCRRTLADRSRDWSFKDAVETKLQPKLAHLRAVEIELEKCVNSAKYWQIRGFSNETNRPGRTTAIKANC